MMPARLFTVKATRQLPALHVTKDFALYASKDETLHKGSSLDLEPCELFGFNLGDMAKSGQIDGYVQPLESICPQT